MVAAVYRLRIKCHVQLLTELHKFHARMVFYMRTIEKAGRAVMAPRA